MGKESFFALILLQAVVYYISQEKFCPCDLSVIGLYKLYVEEKYLWDIFAKVKRLPDLYFAEGLDSSSVLTTHWENLNINRSKLPGKSKFKRRKNNDKNFEYFLE